MNFFRHRIPILWIIFIVVFSTQGCSSSRRPRRPDRGHNNNSRNAAQRVQNVAAELERLQKICTTTFTSFENISRWYDLLSIAHPDLVQIKEIGESHELRKLRVLRISPRRRNDRPAIFLEATQHAREWLAPVTVNNLIKDFIKGHRSNLEIYRNAFERYIFYFMSVANPDGYVYSHLNQSTRLWRKNRRRNGNGGCYGVDLNRNWDIGRGGPGASNDICSDVYAGPSAFSEPETIALRNFLNNEIKRGKLTLYISVHSYSQLWIIPYSYKKEHPANYNEMFRVANITRYVVSNGSKDNRYEVVNGAEVFGVTIGGSDDWILNEMRANYSYTLELRPSLREIIATSGFLASEAIIPRSGREAKTSLLTMIKHMNP